MDENIVVMSTCNDATEAQRIARETVERRLAACVQILPPMQSVYRWRGKTETATECLLLFKTKSAKFELLRKAIEELHSYEVPECVVLGIQGGSSEYLAWLSEAVNG